MSIWSQIASRSVLGRWRKPLGKTRVERHRGLTFLVTQSLSQSTARGGGVFTRQHKLTLVNSASISVQLERHYFSQVKLKGEKKTQQNHSVFRPECSALIKWEMKAFAVISMEDSLWSLSVTSLEIFTSLHPQTGHFCLPSKAWRHPTKKEYFQVISGSYFSLRVSWKLKWNHQKISAKKIYIRVMRIPRAEWKSCRDIPFAWTPHSTLQALQSPITKFSRKTQLTVFQIFFYNTGKAGGSVVLHTRKG